MRRRDDDKTRKFNFKQVPDCKFVKRVKLSNGMVIEVCLARKGVGRHKQVCTHAGVYAQCKFYEPKYKWGRSLYELAGDFVHG